MTFNFKDLSYMKMALHARVAQLSSVEEDDPGIDEDRFREMQDEIEYMQRLEHMLDQQMAEMRSEVHGNRPPLGLITGGLEKDSE